MITKHQIPNIKLIRMKTLFSKFMAIRYTFLCFFIILIQSVLAQERPKKVDEVFQLVFEQQNQFVYFEWLISEDYYLYDNKFTVSADEGINVSIVDKTKYSDIIEDEFFGNQKIHEQYVVIKAQLITELEDISEKKIYVQYQGCWKKGICYLPQKREFLLKNLKAIPALDPVKQNPAGLFDNQSISQFVDGSNVSFFSNLLDNQSIWFIILLFFLAGIALSLTPCVIPMYPILSSIILGQKENELSKMRSFTLSLTYVLSMSLAYSLAGMIAGLFGFNFQIYFQHPLILSFFSLFFFIFALALFFDWNFQMPQLIQTFANKVSQKQNRGTYIGVAIMGFLSALIVGPCIAAPIAGALIYMSEQGDPVLGGISLFSLSLGMGLPVLIVGTSAGRISIQYNQWINQIKNIFAFVLLALGVSMLDRFINDQIAFLAYACILLMFTIFFGALSPIIEDNKLFKLKRGLLLFLFIYSILLIIGGFTGRTNFLQPIQFGLNSKNLDQKSIVKQDENQLDFTTVTTIEEFERLLESTKDQVQPAMVYFYADWCISCVTLKNQTFADKNNQALLKQMRLILVDITKNDDDAQELMRKFSVIGPPALFFYNQENQFKTDLDVHGFIQAETFLKILQKLNNKV